MGEHPVHAVVADAAFAEYNMLFNFDLATLNEGDLETLSITKHVGQHSVMQVRMRHSFSPVDLSALMGKAVSCTFDDTLGQVPVFKGVVTNVEFVGGRTVRFPMLQVTAYSDSVKADVVPRYRIFQDPNATLQQIVQTVSGEMACNAEIKDGDFSSKVPLTIQYAETDFDYLQRLVGVHGIPLIVDDINNNLYIGQPPGKSATILTDQAFTDLYIGTFGVHLGNQSVAPSPGVIGAIQAGTSNLMGQLGDRTQYLSNKGFPDSQKNQETFLGALDVAQHTCEAGQRVIQTRRTFLNVADKVTLPDGKYTVYGTTISYAAAGAQSENVIEQHHRLVGVTKLKTYVPVAVPWHSKTFLARVTKNEGDPENLGRVQVRFDWEKDQSTADPKQCWVDVVTPYAGSADESFGFLMLPEVDEQVLITFMEPWDDKPLLVGSLRRQTVHEKIDTAKYKTIRTPKGNRINLISEDGDEETIQIRAGYMDVHHIDITTKDDKTEIFVQCNDKINILGKDILVEGETIALHSTDKMTLKSDGTLDIASTGKMSIQSEADLQALSASGTKIVTDASLQMKSQSGTDIQSSAIVKVKGAMIKLN